MRHFWPEDTLTKVLVFLLVLAIGIGGFLRFLIGDDFIYTLWSDRELYRAFNLSREFQSSGPESNFGGRIPGGGIYYLLRALMLISTDPGAIHKMMLTLDCAAALVVFSIGLRYLGLLSALIAAFFALTMSYAVDNLSQIWNPGFTSLPLALAIFFLLRLVIDHRQNAFPLFVLCTGIAAQAHFSAYGLLAAALLAVAAFRIQIGVRTWLLGGIVLLLLLAPYFIHEAATGFANSRALIAYQELAGIGGEEAPIRPWSFDLLVGRLVDFASWASGTIWYAPPTTLFAGLKWFVTVVSTTFLGLMIVVLSMRLLVRRRADDSEDGSFCDLDHVRLLVRLCYLTISVAIVSVCALGLPPIPRYFAYALPALYLLGGAAFADLVALIHRVDAPSLRCVSAIGLTLWACVGGLLSVYYWPSRAYQPSGMSLAWHEVRELLVVARDQYGLAGEHVHQRLAVAYSTADGSLRPVDYLTSAFEYPALLFRSRPSEVDIGQTCLFAVKTRGPENQPSSEHIRAAIKRLAVPLGGASLLKFSKTNSFSLISYVPHGRNCFRNINNRYLKTALERDVGLALDGQPQDHAIELQGATNERRFVFRKSGIWPFEAMVSITFAPNGTTSTMIVSNDLRGYTGLVSHKILRPRIEFRSQNQASATLIIFDGEFGETLHDFILPPWTSDSIVFPMAPYDIYFVIDGHVADRHQSGAYELKLGSSN